VPINSIFRVKRNTSLITYLEHVMLREATILDG
jgi:hypothetical protein